MYLSLPQVLSLLTQTFTHSKKKEGKLLGVHQGIHLSEGSEVNFTWVAHFTTISHESELMKSVHASGILDFLL